MEDKTEALLKLMPKELLEEMGKPDRNLISFLKFLIGALLFAIVSIITWGDKSNWMVIITFILLLSMFIIIVCVTVFKGFRNPRPLIYNQFGFLFSERLGDGNLGETYTSEKFPELNAQIVKSIRDSEQKNLE